MRITALILISLLTCLVAGAATPTAFHITSGSVNQNESSTVYDVRFPQPTFAGNLIAVFIQYGGTSTITVTDDQSQTWTCNTAISGGQQVRLCFFANTVANVVKVHVVLGTSQTAVGASLVEMNGIKTTSALDKTCGTNTATTTSAPCGSMTTTVNGDAILEFCAQDSAAANAETWTAGSGFTLLTNDKFDSQGSQFEVQSSLGAINPTMTMSAGASKTCVGAAFFADTTKGNTPSGMYIHSIHFNAFNPSNAYPGSGATTINFPCPGGNAYFLSFLGEPNVTISGTPTDSLSDTLTSTGSTISNGTSGNLQAWRIGSGASLTAPMTVSFTTTGSQVSGSTATLYCIAGSGGYDTRGTANGVQSVAGTLTTASVTPTHSSGIIIWVLGVNSDTVPGVNIGTFNSPVPSPVTSPNDVSQNNGWGNLAYSSTATQTFIANTSLGGGAYQNWASTADAFFAPAAGSPTCNSIALLGVGCH